MYKFLSLLVICIIVINCSKQTIYSGKILNQDNLNNINFINKKALMEDMGNPSFIDPVENKFFYFSEKKSKKSAFDEKIDYSYMFVFKFDSDDKITSTEVFDLKNKSNLNIIDEQTENEVVKRGLIEKIFGGVGPQQELPSSP